MCRPFATLSLLVVCAIGALAGPPPLTITDAGYFITDVDEAGNPSFVKVDDIIDLRTGQSPPVTPETPEPKTLEPPAKGISADAWEWAEQTGDSAGAQKYVSILETVRDGVLADKVTSGTLFEVLKKSADVVVDKRWDSFRRQLGDYLVERLQSADLLTKEQIADQLERVRYGVAYSARESETIAPVYVFEVILKVNSVIDGVNGE